MDLICAVLVTVERAVRQHSRPEGDNCNQWLCVYLNGVFKGDVFHHKTLLINLPSVYEWIHTQFREYDVVLMVVSVHYPTAGGLRCLVASADAPFKAVMLNSSEAEDPKLISSCVEPEGLSEEEEQLPREGGELCTLRGLREPAKHRLSV